MDSETLGEELVQDTVEDIKRDLVRDTIEDIDGKIRSTESISAVTKNDFDFETVGEELVRDTIEDSDIDEKIRSTESIKELVRDTIEDSHIDKKTRLTESIKELVRDIIEDSGFDEKIRSTESIKELVRDTIENSDIDKKIRSLESIKELVRDTIEESDIDKKIRSTESISAVTKNDLDFETLREELVRDTIEDSDIYEKFRFTESISAVTKKDIDFETLGEELVRDTIEDSDIYEKIRSTESISAVTKNDFEKAKGFLSTVNSKLNISLYDHLADVLQTILRSKIPNAIDKLEELSLHVKKVRLADSSTLTEVFEIGEDLEAYIKEKQMFYKFITSVPDISEAVKTADEDEEEEEESEEEDEEDKQVEEEEEEPIPDQQPVDLSSALPDIHYVMGRFGQAGIGLSSVEVHELSLAIKDLAVKFGLLKVRFWGKVLGTGCDYYVAEAPYQEGVVQEDFGWEARKEPEMPTEPEPMAEAELEEEEDEDVDEEDDKEEPEESEEQPESEAVKIPPIPEPKSKPRKTIPPEANGKGVNEFVYFVCTKIGHPWRVLPFMTPSHVSEARYVKRIFKGELESQIRGSVCYPGTEAHYLRAQIARITASTYIAPVEYYKLAGEKDEDEEEPAEDEEESEDKGIVPNAEFVPRSAKYLYSEGLRAWVHYRPAVLDQGRCTPMKLEKSEDEEDTEKQVKEEEDDEDEEEAEEEEEPEILEAIVETEVPRLRSLTEDRALGRLKPWTRRLSSQLIEETAVLVLHSSLWPGAYTFYDGRSFDHIYIGYGYKFTVFHYAPPVRASWQREYVVGRDVTEHVDEEILPQEPEDDENKDEEKEDEEADEEPNEEEEEEEEN